MRKIAEFATEEDAMNTAGSEDLMKQIVPPGKEGYRVDYNPEDANPVNLPYHVHRGMGKLHWFADLQIATDFCESLNNGITYQEAVDNL